METLLPSEIARLVLGYLYDQKCEEAAKVFLETCPHLQECRTVISNGRRFSTKVSGMTLLDVLEKFSAVNTMIQERLSRISDCEQLKHCGDLLEQLKYIVEEPRGQRFVVNINVPTQANAPISNCSPILSSSQRNRRYSNNDRERSKRHRTPSNVPEQSESPLKQVTLDVVEATPLETLPGHIQSQKEVEHINAYENINITTVSEAIASCHSDKGTFVDISVNVETENKPNSKEKCNNKQTLCRISDVASSNKSQDVQQGSPSFEKCTTATNTEELLSFSCAEVQTTPYDTPESESETNDEPIENLSLLTKELLNRTELQEKIAENINKAILPVDVSLKDEVLNSSGNFEANTSIMAELNHAIKSIVEATESDPVFENFLYEIIGPDNETDTSPDEEPDTQLVIKTTPECSTGSQENDSDPIKTIEPLQCATGNVEPTNEIEVHQKCKDGSQDSSKQEIVELPVAIVKQYEQDKEQNALEDQNAAAIMSIINANFINSNSVDNNKTNAETTLPVCETVEKQQPAVDSASILKESLTNNNNLNPTSKKSMHAVKRIRPTRIKRDTQLHTNEFISEQDILTMPTLIVCSKNEIDNMMSTAAKNQSDAIRIETKETPRFVPICAKPESKGKTQSNEDTECIYLRSVQIPQRSSLPSMTSDVSLLTSKPKRNIGDINLQGQTTVTTVTAVTAPTFSLPLPMSLPVPVPMPMSVPMTLTVPVPVSSMPLPSPIPVPTQPVCRIDNMVENTNKLNGLEGITLYGKENSVRGTLDNTDVPIINVDETISLSGTGLSPYLKFSSNKTNPNYSLSEIELTAVPEQQKATKLHKSDTANESHPSTSKCDVIAKHTPRTLLKSRSKNHRLSLSTPRRNSHVRALDFNTPTKRVTGRSVSENEADGVSPTSIKHAKSVCRTSLFKSPPGFNNTVTANEPKAQKHCSRKVPIATRSPRPKLMGGWERHNGVGVIIGEVSPQGNGEDTDSELIIDNTPKPTLKVSKGNWDADLRRALQIPQVQNSKTKKSTSKSRKDADDVNKMRIPTTRKTKKIINSETGDSASKKQSQAIETTIQLHKVQTTSERDNKTKGSSQVKPEIPQKKCTVVPQKRSNNSASKCGEKTVKKYAELKTIKTDVKCKSDNADSQVAENKEINAQVQSVTQTSEFQKIAIDMASQALPMSAMVDLDTPRKFDDSCGPPPTPRLLSPNSNTVTPFVKISDDSSKMRSIISTPEFPTTPCVTFTPKHIQESIRDSGKKEEFISCSPYYKPTGKQEGNSEKLAKEKIETVQDSLKSSLSAGTVEATDHQTYTSNRLEITQFEVIKENLPKEEAVKELKISTGSKDSSAVSELQTHCQQNGATQHMAKNVLLDVNSYHSPKKDGTCSRTNDIEAENIVEDCGREDNDADVISNDSNTSDSESTTSSSSSGSSTSNVSNYSEEYAAYNKSRRSGGKLYADMNNSCVQRSARVTRSTTNEAIKNAQIEALKIKSDVVTDDTNTGCKEEKSIGTTSINHPDEASPTKVFSITKTDEQLKANMKETPAKDETLLNEADISETPSGSKSGVENLTNLSSKISAIISSEENLDCPKPNESAAAEQNTANKIKQKPRILSVQNVKSNIQTVPLTYTINKEHTIMETGHRSLCIDEKLIVQLEAKRQRLIAKFREGPPTNVARGRGNRRRTTFRGRRTGLNGLRRTCHPVATTTQYNYAQNTNGDVAVEEIDVSNNNNSTATVIEDEKKTELLENAHPNIMHISSNMDYENVSSADEYSEKTLQEIEEVVEQCKPAEKNVEKDVGHTPQTSSVTQSQNLAQEKVEEVHSPTYQNPNSTQRITETVTQNNVSSESIKNASLESVDRINQAKYLFKAKVDQVKRDLFSDEEVDQRESYTMKSESVNDESGANKNTTSSSPKKLSHVLQCLELVPTSKNDESNAVEEEQDVDECINTTESNLVEYHFIYDESVPIKRRRRRYSNRDLEFHANILLTQEDNKECMKLMTPTDLEEIFNISPKMKKRLPNKKPEKNVKSSVKDDSNPTLGTSTTKSLQSKPLATSSPLEKPITHKIKKGLCKTQTVNEKHKEPLTDTRKRIKLEKSPESEKVDNHDKKSRKRKLSESKDSSQAEKKQNTTDPHLLLSKLVDVDKFLTKVHGPA